MDVGQVILSGMAAVVMICFGMIAWFMKGSLSESRQNTLEIGILRGTIESNKTKSHDDVDSLSRETNLKLQHLSVNVDMLAKSVNKLMDLILNTNFSKSK